MKITRVHAPSLNGDYFVKAADEATGQRYRFCADQYGTSAVFRQEGRSWVQIDPTPALSRIARKVVRQAH
jgi:hypothetical protein